MLTKKMTTELPYAVPKNVPKWVAGFPDFLENSLHVGGSGPATLREAWRAMEEQYWANFHACGKKRSKADKKTKDSGDEAAEKVKKPRPQLSKRVREHLKQLERIAQEMGSPEMADTVAQLRSDLEQ
jgi:hypothetical protein